MVPAPVDILGSMHSYAAIASCRVSAMRLTMHIGCLIHKLVMVRPQSQSACLPSRTAGHSQVAPLDRWPDSARSAEFVSAGGRTHGLRLQPCELHTCMCALTSGPSAVTARACATTAPPSPQGFSESKGDVAPDLTSVSVSDLLKQQPAQQGPLHIHLLLGGCSHVSGCSELRLE